MIFDYKKSCFWSWLIFALSVATLSMAAVIDLKIDAPVDGIGTEWPMYVGVPVPIGELSEEDSVAVMDSQGRVVFSQQRTLAKWVKDDSVRWLGLDFVGNPKERYSVCFGDDIPPRAKAASIPKIIKVEKVAEGWMITTGPARFLVTANGPLISRAWLENDGRPGFDDNELMLSTEKSELYVTDQNGKTGWGGMDEEADSFSMEPDLDSIEAMAGLLHLAVRREGWYTAPQDGDRMARHITRLHFYAGQPFVRIEHTIVLTRHTEETGLLERHTKEPPIWFRDIGISFNHALDGPLEARFNDDHSNSDSSSNFSITAKDEAYYMFQEKGFFFDKIDPAKDNRFEIGREGRKGGGEVLREGGRSGNWAGLTGDRGRISLAIRDFWKLYPKELKVSGEALTARLWSNRGGRDLDFRLDALMERWPAHWLSKDVHGEYGNAYDNMLKNRGRNYALGLARTHELILNMEKPQEKRAAAVAAALDKPVAVLADPHWLYKTEAMSPLYPQDRDGFPLAEGFMKTYLEQYKAVMDSWGDYGFIDYGNRPHVWYRRMKADADHPLAGRLFPYLFRYSSLVDYGFAGHLWRMYARSGDRAYLDLAEETNRHRMDICMVHWDSPGVNYARANGWMIGKYKGGFSGSYSIVPWAISTILHNQSGSELRHLFWYYYLRDYRRAHDVAEEYRTLVKKLWTEGSRSPFTGTRPFGTLKNLATLYQETGDELVLEIGRSSLERFVDLDSPQGVSSKLATGLAKSTTKNGAIERWYEATGDKLAEQSILRVANVYARTSLGNSPYSYYNIYGRILNRAYRITGDPLYARILKRNMELAVDRFYDYDKAEWRDVFTGSPVISASNSAYPMGDMALGMDAITRAGDIGPVPLLQQREQGRPLVAVFRKERGKSIVFDVRGRVPLKPQVYKPNGQAVANVKITPFTETLWSLKKTAEPNCFMVEVPAGLAEGEYLLDAGVEGAPWEITWSDAQKLVYYAPGGISAGGGPAWYFKVPKEQSEFQVYSRGQVALFQPDGTRIHAITNQPWSDIAVPTEMSDRFWRFESHTPQNYFEVRGLPAVLVSDTRGWFMPDLRAIDVDRFQLQPAYEGTEVQDPLDAEVFVEGRSKGRKALSLHSSRAFKVKSPDDKPLLRAQSGTIEMWFRPNWSSVYGARNNTVLQADYWGIEFNYLRFCNSLMRFSSKRHGRRDLLNGVTLERGQWYHIAWQWENSDDKRFKMEMYVNGERQGKIESDQLAPADDSLDEDGGESAPQLLINDLAELQIGHRRWRSKAQGSLDGTVDELRFSAIPRYRSQFTPPRTFSVDRHTLALFTFDDVVEGKRGDGSKLAVELMK